MHLIVFEVHYILCICVAQRIYVNSLLLENILLVTRLNPIKIVITIQHQRLVSFKIPIVKILLFYLDKSI